ncbi:MAG: hypothetical protein ACYDEQ_10905 [Desulfocucumaceae bacterium]
MPYKGLSNGLYLVKQKSRLKPGLIDHYGVIDIGNLLQHPQGTPRMPFVIHQTHPFIRIDWLYNTGKWNILGKVADHEVVNAKKRLQRAIQTPQYDLFGHNCEHFARYVTMGKKESHQLQSSIALVSLGVIIYTVWKFDQK